MTNEVKIFCLKEWSSGKEKEDYELLDTGDRERLERFGKYTFVRPYEDAVWPKTLENGKWEKIDGKFWSSKEGAKSGWDMEHKVELKWEMSYKGIKFLASPTPFRHLGFFPEQASHWDFIEEKIKSVGRPVKFLNLFGYTGVASLFALRAGAEVTHLDASKQTLNWAKENEKLNNLAQGVAQGESLRVIEDDALKFLEREEKRGNKYDAIVMEPPKFGRGPKGEVWKIEEMLPKLLSAVRKVLSDKPLFVILTSYAIDASSLSLGHALKDMMKPARNASGIDDAGGDFGGDVESGELCVLEKSNNRIIPLANTAVWSALEK